MTEYIQFKTSDGSTILVEAEETIPAGVVKAGLGDTIQEKIVEAKTTFDDAVDSVRQSAEVLIKKVRSLSDPPDEVEVAFGLKVSGEAGNFAVAKVGMDANYTVKMTWKREKKDKGKKDKGN